MCYCCRLPGHGCNNCPKQGENSGDHIHVHMVDELEEDEYDKMMTRYIHRFRR